MEMKGLRIAFSTKETYRLDLAVLSCNGGEAPDPY